jgi:hypothetical protein
VPIGGGAVCTAFGRLSAPAARCPLLLACVDSTPTPRTNARARIAVRASCEALSFSMLASYTLSLQDGETKDCTMHTGAVT